MAAFFTTKTTVDGAEEERCRERQTQSVLQSCPSVVLRRARRGSGTIQMDFHTRQFSDKNKAHPWSCSGGPSRTGTSSRRMSQSFYLAITRPRDQKVPVLAGSETQPPLPRRFPSVRGFFYGSDGRNLATGDGHQKHLPLVLVLGRDGRTQRRGQRHEPAHLPSHVQAAFTWHCQEDPASRLHVCTQRCWEHSDRSSPTTRHTLTSESMCGGSSCRAGPPCDSVMIAGLGPAITNVVDNTLAKVLTRSKDARLGQEHRLKVSG